MGISFNAAALLNGNGIDVNAVVSEIQAAQTGELTTWKAEQTTLQTQATAISTINTDLSNLQSAVQNLTGSNGALTAETANSSESAVVTATAQTGAATADYSVIVKTLASTGTLYTDSVTDANTSILQNGQAGGELDVLIGTSNPTTAVIPITAGSNDTLTTLAQSINTLSASDNWGITANVVTDANGAHLAIYSQSTGSAGLLAVGANTGTILNFEPAVGGTDADISINGIPYASTTNTVTGAIPDVTLDLATALPGTPVTITVGPDTTAITNAINNFVTEYNTVIGDINTQFTVNAATNTEGPLGADTYLRNLQSSLLADAGYQTTDPTSISSGLTNLAQLGISMNQDTGLLTVNQTAIDTATQYSPGFSDVLANNLSALQNFFTNSNSTGFADSFSADLTNLTDPSTGPLNADLTANQAQQTALATDITNFQAQLAAQKSQLDQEFDTVNANLEEYPFTLAEVTAALGSMSSSSTTTSTAPTTNTNTTPTSGESTSGNSGSSS